ncbi:helix-turn-helix domain-containing protein [Vibrio maritimus]|uniref:helix-turn-helix domain-containing protein n=1 Tax=Vibrio maritimus TaxID=990268 RepID=UPI001F19B3F9|nr:AraC family transcriptional regulator [Vibrio maritimus]
MPGKKKTYYELEIERIYKEHSMPARKTTLIRQSKAFMEAHHAESIDLDDLAKAAFMSRFHYIRVFKQLYGVTPRNYLRDMRISKAKLYLKQGRTITDVCLAVGYESVATFSNTFKKCTSMSPREYQERNRE